VGATVDAQEPVGDIAEALIQPLARLSLSQGLALRLIVLLEINISLWDVLYAGY